MPTLGGGNSMTQKLADHRPSTENIEQVVIEGDLKGLSASQRLTYYQKVCATLGLNPYTKPFAYLYLNNKLVLYALRDATDQLRAVKGISVTITARENTDGIYTVTAKASDKAGRTAESIGAVNVAALKGDALANAYMKAETKAKRRVTLSIAGLGWLDETEADTIAGARVVPVDHDTGEMVAPPQRAAIAGPPPQQGQDDATEAAAPQGAATPPAAAAQAQEASFEALSAFNGAWRAALARNQWPTEQEGLAAVEGFIARNYQGRKLRQLNDAEVGWVTGALRQDKL